MKISVVIPCYNAANTIDAAIQSCLQQSFTPYEVIIVDDASTDNTVAIVGKYKQVTLLIQETNKGPSAARNRGWEEATGDYIAFLDSDDIWHKDKLNIIQRTLAANPKIEYIGHAYTLGDFSDITSSTPYKKSYTSILLRNPYQPSCLIIKRNIPERFDESYRYCEDHQLSLTHAHNSNCYFIDTELTMLGRPQLSAGGASGNKWKMRKGELRIYTSIIKHNPLYIFIVPFLWIYSLLKMGYKSIN